MMRFCNSRPVKKNTQQAQKKQSKENKTGFKPETLGSIQEPLTKVFPSGQIQLAPVGLSKHIKSQIILRQGLATENKTQ